MSVAERKGTFGWSLAGYTGACLLLFGWWLPEWGKRAAVDVSSIAILPAVAAALYWGRVGGAVCSGALAAAVVAHGLGQKPWQYDLVSLFATVGFSILLGHVVDVQRTLRMEMAARELAEQRLAVANRELREANEELEAFVARVSHDLKSPLRSIYGFAAQIREDYGEAIGDEGRHTVRRIENAAGRMNGLIEALLAHARARTAPLVVQAVAIADLVPDILEHLDAGERFPTSRVTVRQGPSAMANVPLVRQVLANLLDNALKYSAGAGEPEIEVGTVAVAGESRIYVRDNGPGVAELEREQVFTMFTRGRNGILAEGSGIGLTTVKAIAERHGGRAWVEEAPEGGALFWVSLPAAEAAVERSGPKAGSAA